MVSSRVIAVTGATHFWGGWLARRLSEAGHTVLAVDNERPDPALHGIEFIEADLANPLLPEVFQSYSVEQILHLGFKWERRATDAGFEHNVIGTGRLLESAARAGVRQVVVMSHILAYGARPDNPAFIPETARLRGGEAGYARHLAEIEDVVHKTRSQSDAPAITVLRFAHIVGPSAPSPINTMLKLWATPTLLGFDPLIQLIHEDDVAAALEHALLGWEDTPYNGAVNIAAHPPMPLAKVLRAAGVTTVPVLHPLAYLAGRAGKLGGMVNQAQPLDWDYLRYSVVGDLTRMTNDFGFTPNYDTDAMLAPLIERGDERRAMLSLKRPSATDETALSEETPNG